jgi:SPP1 gp7 family putative phage head morphogenesis protein
VIEKDVVNGSFFYIYLMDIGFSYGSRDAAEFVRMFRMVHNDENPEMAVLVQESIAFALEKGLSCYEWRKELKTRLLASGLDSLDKDQAEDIFQQIFSLAYGAVHWEQSQRVKAMFPYYRYSTLKSHLVRPSHFALEGLIFSADNIRFFPPIAWGCRCIAIPITRREAERLGITKPDVVTPEMQTALDNDDFTAVKVQLFDRWLAIKNPQKPR